MLFWYETKQFVEHATAISMDALHVLIGVIIFLGLSLLLRRPVTDWRPWLAVLGLTLLNEAIDIWVERWPSPGMQLGESAKDIALTLLLPTVILLSARRFPALFKRRTTTDNAAPPAAGTS
jgi:diacylglycerol kinase